MTELQTMVVGGGCFWCTDAVFRSVIGATNVVAGYAGGELPHPNYEQVCSETTGHAEVIQVTFDPAIITYPELLEIFFGTHDPTTLNRQGHDVGESYRSIILTSSDEQTREAEAMIAKLNADNTFSSPIVTEIKPLTVFYPAEDYHQNYYAQNGQAGYCRAVIDPKIAKFRKQFAHKLKS